MTLALMVALPLRPGRSESESPRAATGLHATGADAQAGSEPPQDEEADVPYDMTADPLYHAGEGAEAVIEEIVVKGTASKGLSIDEAGSVTTFDSDDIAALGVTDIADLATFTPNVEVVQASATAPTFFVRGVGLADFASNAPISIAVFRDGAPINAPAIQLVQLYDVATVDVRRGPQPWGPFRNASGGAFIIDNVQPSGQLGGYVRGEYGSFDRGVVEGAFDLPLLEDVLSSRVSFHFEREDGYFTNGCADVQVPLVVRLENPRPFDGVKFCDRQQDPINLVKRRSRLSVVEAFQPGTLGALKTWGARVQLRWTPEVDAFGMDWTLNAHGGEINADPPMGQAIGTAGFQFASNSANYVDPDIEDERGFVAAGLRALDPSLTNRQVDEISRTIVGRDLARRLDIRPFRGDINRYGSNQMDMLGGGLRGELDFDAFRIRSTTGVEYYDRFREEDNDFTPAVLFEAVGDDSVIQVTQELALESRLEEHGIEWEVGAVFLYEKLDSDFVYYLGVTNRSTQRQSFEQEIYSINPWVGIEWEFLDDFRLEAGFRYNYEQKEYLQLTLDRFGFIVPAPPLLIEASPVFQAPTGGVQLSYHFAESAQLYAKYNRGWKAGHINAVASFDGGPDIAEPEVVDAFEVGMRGAFWESRIMAGLAGFFYNYDNYQVLLVESSVNRPPIITIQNAKAAQNAGIEIDAMLRPLEGLVDPAFEGLTIDLRFAWLQTEFLDFTNEIQRQISLGGMPPNVVTAQIVVDYTGNRLPSAPPYSLSGGVEWEFDLGKLGVFVPRYDFSYTGEVFFDPSNGRGQPNLDNQIYMPEYAIGQQPYALHHLRLAYRPPTGHVEIAAYVRNLTDQVYKTYAYDASVFLDLVGNYVGEPRVLGVTLGVDF